MAVYYFMIGAFSLLGILLFRKGDVPSRRTIFLLAVFFVLWIFSALRYHVGYDYSYVYAPHYHMHVLYNPDFSLLTSSYEPGFVLLEMLISRISLHYQFFFVATAAIFAGILCLYLYQFSPVLPVSLLVLFLLGEYYASMNFVRQSIAAVIACFSVSFLMKRQFHWYLLVILGAACFHKSALIMLPFFFVNLIPLITKRLLAVYLLITAGLYVLLPYIVRFVTSYWYTLYVEDNEYMQVKTPWPFAVVAGGIFLIFFLCRKYLLSQDKQNYVYVNYAFFSFFFVLMGTQYSVIHRLFYYFEFPLTVGIALLLQQLWKSREKDKSPRIPAAVTGFFVLMGFWYHHYALAETMDIHGVVPYQTILSQPFYREYVAGIYAPHMRPDADLSADVDISPAPLDAESASPSASIESTTSPPESPVNIAPPENAPIGSLAETTSSPDSIQADTSLVVVPM